MSSTFFFFFDVPLDINEKSACDAAFPAGLSSGAAICDSRSFLSSAFFRFSAKPHEPLQHSELHCLTMNALRDFHIKERAPSDALRTKAIPGAFLPNTPGNQSFCAKEIRGNWAVRQLVPAAPPREVMRYIWSAPFDCQAPFFNFFHPPRHPFGRAPHAGKHSRLRVTPLTKSQPCAGTLTATCSHAFGLDLPQRPPAIRIRGLPAQSGGPANHRDAYGHLAIFCHDWHPLIWPCVEYA